MRYVSDSVPHKIKSFFGGKGEIVEEYQLFEMLWLVPRPLRKMLCSLFLQESSHAVGDDTDVFRF